MQESDIVSIVFRLLNFGALIALGIYLFKRYLLGSITLQIAKRQQKLADLSLQNQLLKDQTKAMDFTFAEQQAVSRVLLQKIDVWKALVSQRMLERDQEKVMYESALAQRMKTQQAYLALCSAQKRALLPAIDKAREALIVNYNAAPLGQSFISEIVKHMEKS